MRRRSTLFFFGSVLAGLGASRDAGADGASIAVVDLQGAVMQTEDGIRAQATLKKLFDKRQQDLDAKQTKLAKMREDIERQSKVLSREALARRMDFWQKEMISLQTVFVDYNKELSKKQAELTQPIIQKMVAIIGKLARQNGHDLVLDKQAAPYARPDLDLTDKVVSMYNSGESG
ncbi:MAG: OmpH family outer membrane protein [Myxococcales bacterium]|nr:OmpH family outer membrane protein [Myxococcales bacterium]